MIPCLQPFPQTHKHSQVIKAHSNHRFHLIVNADDFGYCEERNRGILQLVERGKLSSLSAIVNAPHISTHLHHLSPYSSLSIGLHLNLTEFQPLSQPQNREGALCCLIRKEGLFVGKKRFYELIERIESERSEREDIWKQTQIFIQGEVRAQIEKFMELFQRRPSHIDGHNHVHVIPIIAQVISETAPLYGIYSIRMVRPISLETPNQTLNQFNAKVVRNAKVAMKEFYVPSRFIYPDFLIGLKCIGNRISAQAVQEEMEEIIRSTEKAKLMIELMVHPGYSQQKDFHDERGLALPVCPFSRSEERQEEMKVLCSEQFGLLLQRYRLSNFHELGSLYQDQLKVLIYSKLVVGSGNLTTSLRLKEMLIRMGYAVYFMNSQPTDQEGEVMKMGELIRQMQISLVIGINLTNTAEVIYSAVRGQESVFEIPYFLIIAGTDANLTFQQEHCSEKREGIEKSIHHCSCLVSISREMKAIMDNYLVKAEIKKEIVLIEQGIHPCSLIAEQKHETRKEQPYIVFPTSFRKVKAIEHMLKELTYLSNLHSIPVYILGPILDQPYYSQIIGALRQEGKKAKHKVEYKGCLSHGEYLRQYLLNAHVVLNTSQCEGMCCSILEAFINKVPVLARDNAGNRGLLVEDGLFGFLYSTREHFIETLTKLITDPIYYNQVKEQMCQRAYERVQQRFSFQKQFSLYKGVLETHQWFTTVVDGGFGFPMLSLKGVHGVSEVNLKIFNELFFGDGVNDVSEGWQFISGAIKEGGMKILDMGTGNGIFIIYFLIMLVRVLKKSKQAQLQIEIVCADFDPTAVANCSINLHRFLNHPSFHHKDFPIHISRASVVESDMFESLRPHYTKYFNIILANMPQTPFQHLHSRVDKNGGPDALKFNRLLIQQYQQFLSDNSSFMAMLYSYMCQPQEFQSIVHASGSAVKWTSHAQTHVIAGENYDQMEEGLSQFLKGFRDAGKAHIQVDEKNRFHVPAELRIIQPND